MGNVLGGNRKYLDH